MSERSLNSPGLMLSCELEPHELIRLSQLAEWCGYDEIWYTDQRFWRDCYVGLAQIAAATERIRLGPGVNDPFTRHPALIAMSIATLDEISGGRAQLGLGVGGSGIQQMHLPKERPVRALAEAIDIIRLMLGGGPVDYAGELFQLTGAKMSAPLPSKPIPISVATHGPQVLKLCGKTADGVLLGNMGNLEAIDTAKSLVEEGARSANRPPSAITMNLRLEALISEDREEAFSVMRTRMAHRLITSYPNWDFLGAHRSQLDPNVVYAAAARDRTEVARLLTEDDVRTQALVGDPHDVAEQLCSLAAGAFDKVTIRPYGFDGHGQDITIRYFSEAVWPRFLDYRRSIASA
jgi:5,10-methylenetetrahydromethanopterin reductase